MNKASELSDLILKPLETGLKEITNLISTFEKTSDSLSQHQSSIQKIHESFIIYDLSNENPLLEIISGLKSIFSCWSFGLYRLKNNLHLEILEPLKLVAENLNNLSKVFEKDIGSAEESLQVCTKRLTECKSKYFKDAETLETLETQRFGKINPIKHNLQGSVSLQLVECLDAEKKLNESHETFESVSLKLIEGVKKNEESRMYFIKTSTEKFIHHFTNFFETILDKVKEIGNGVGKLNCFFSVDEFYAKLNEFIPPKLAFETYNSWKHKNKSVEMVEDSLVVNSTIELLINKKSSELASVDKLMEIVENFEGQEWFFRVLEQKLTEKSIGHYEITKLGEIFIRILESLPKIERSYSIFGHIIKLSEQIWTNHQSNKKFLYEFLMADNGLLEVNRWKYLIESEIEEKWKKEMIMCSKMKKRSKSRGFFDSIRKMTNLSNDKFEIKPDEVKRKLARDALMSYSCKLWKFRVDPETSYIILMPFAIEYKIDSDSVVDILSIIRPAREYHRHHSKSRFKIIEKKLIFKALLPYLTIKDQIQLIQVSKFIKTELSESVYRNILKNPIKKSLKNRQFIWVKILKPYFPAHTYEEIVIDLAINNKTIAKLKKVIKLDVIRSYACKETQGVIKRVLQAYALHNRHVGYCQGMNFIVSTFYSVLKDEATTYYCLYAFIQKFKMQVILADNLLGLKCLLYQFDKLIELKIPKIYKIFLATENFSSNFASSWFLTVFSSNLVDKLDILYEIWDFFLAKGWKVVFQVGLILLKIQQKGIIEQYFLENSVHLSSEKMIAQGVKVKNLMKITSEVRISKKHLELLQQDYVKILHDSKTFGI